MSNTFYCFTLKSHLSNFLKVRRYGIEHILVVADVQGLHAMQRFFRELEANPQVFQGVKVYVLGARGAGKTSLLRSLVDKQPLPTDAEERTEGVSLLETLVDVTTGPVGGGAKRARNVTLALWDWAGDERYAAMGMHFLRDYGLVLLCFDATRYRSCVSFPFSFVSCLFPFPLVSFFFCSCFCSIHDTRHSSTRMTRSLHCTILKPAVFILQFEYCKTAVFVLQF